MLGRELDDRRHQLGREDDACGVPGTVDHDQPRSIGDLGAQLVDVGKEVVLRRQRVGHGDGTAKQRGHREVRPRRVGQQHLVAGVEEGGECHGHRLHPALTDDDLVGGVGQPGNPAQAFDDRLAEGGDAEALGVADAKGGGLLCRGDDVRFDREIGLADLEADDPRLGPRQHDVDDLADPGRGHSACPTSQLHPRDSSPGTPAPRLDRRRRVRDANERLFRRSLGLPGVLVNRLGLRSPPTTPETWGALLGERRQALCEVRRRHERSADRLGERRRLFQREPVDGVHEPLSEGEGVGSEGRELGGDRPRHVEVVGGGNDSVDESESSGLIGRRRADR